MLAINNINPNQIKYMNIILKIILSLITLYGTFYVIALLQESWTLPPWFTIPTMMIAFVLGTLIMVTIPKL